VNVYTKVTRGMEMKMARGRFLGAVSGVGQPLAGGDGAQGEGQETQQQERC
jgi:hypothetical protein